MFHCEKTKVRLVVHGDDFTYLGPERELLRMKEKMAEWYEIKFRGIMGDGVEDIKEIVILGRHLRWLAEEDGFVYEADPKHRRILMKDFGLTETSNSVVSPAEKLDIETEEEKVFLGKKEATKFRGQAARASFFLGLDRADIQFATKEVCRGMAIPTERDIGKMKRLVRYLVGAKKLELKFVQADDEDPEIEGYGDSDWAGCRASRKSTSGGILCVGGSSVKSWSSTQGSIAQSSGEAEYYSLIKLAAEALGLQALALDLGWSMKVKLWTDSSAAKSAASRRGLGKTRHLEIKFLWLQEAVRRGRLRLAKIPGAINPSDVLTKPLSIRDISEKLKVVAAYLFYGFWDRCAKD